MKAIHTIAKNTTYLLISTLINYSIGFFTLILTARYLGVEGFGILSLAFAITSIFGIFIDFGLGTLTVREVARDKSLSNKYLTNVVAIKLLLSLLIFFLIASVTTLIGYPQNEVNVIYLITISMIIGTFNGTFTSIFIAHEKVEYQSFSTLINGILIFIGVLIVIHLKLDIISFASIYIICNTAALLYCIIIYAWKFFWPKFEINLNFWKALLKESWPFAITNVFATIYYYIDSVLLSILVNTEVVGWYNAAYRLILVLLFIPVILNTVLFPIMSKRYIESKDSLNLIYQKYFKYMMVIAIPIGIGTTVLANKIIILIYGTNYANSVIALQILVWSSVIIFMTSAFSRLLEASNNQLVLTKIAALCAVLNVILNIIFIPKFSYIAASIITVITELFALILCFITVSSIGYNLSHNILNNFIKIILTSILLGIILIVLKDINLIFSVIIAILIYFAVLYAVGVFQDDDIKLFKQIIGR